MVDAFSFWLGVSLAFLIETLIWNMEVTNPIQIFRGLLSNFMCKFKKAIYIAIFGIILFVRLNFN